MSLETFLSDYGYTAVAIGTFLEGETVLVLNGGRFSYLDF